MSKVISEQIEKTQMLLNGLEGKAELVKNKGLDDEFIKKLSVNNQQMTVYNEELDKLKAELKAKTIQANRKIMEIKSQVKDAKRVIKRDFSQYQWREFGINDKR
ncbi:hypothetical protein GGR21_002093 [Dysgonomonas hofstadii]|uniref:Membrane-binding protein n=1 Tax=Dysgonomonas hofstadii TaxID=637886 RepID=A0A840CUN7_9BACT|nr:membrane-binding protein [Dysgonomonas hofstadii]MBB4036192.1 hypothetical protein [Dysgonomonas hofstadii]